MKINSIKVVKGQKLVEGTLPDIDTDFEGRSRPKVKAYMEERFGHDQVCSVGTVTTLKLKGALKDLDRQRDNDYSQANLMTAIIDMKDETMLDLYKRAAMEPKLKAYIKQQSDLFHMLPVLLDQPKANSIHPCAMIIFPDVMSAAEWVPVRKQQGLIVSEWGGYEMEDAGFLKEDILGIKQLDKFADILKLIGENGGEVPDIYNLPHDPEVYRYFGNGWNGDVFQLGSSGLTEYTKALKPQDIEDLIAAVAVFRPGPMENHYHEIYVKCKNEGRAPKFLWGTEEIAKDTYGLLIYQEQVMQVCQRLGGLSMKEADDVRRAMGKKKLEVLQAWKNRVGQGFSERGCEESVFEEVWDVMIEFAKYSFNKSHSAAYAMTGYVCQYLKVHYPLEYWTVALDYANEEKTLTYLAEIFSTKKASIKPPDINGSGIEMHSDMGSKNIYWGIGSIKGIGEETANQIIVERKANGPYTDLMDFIKRHSFTGSKVKKQTYESLISSGAFDSIEDKVFDVVLNRGGLIKRFREVKKTKIAKPERDPYTIGVLHEKWWWLLKQKELTGLAYVNFDEICVEQGINAPFATPMQIGSRQQKGIFRSFGGYVVDMKVSRSKRGNFARITIEHNYKLFKLVIWSDEYEEFKEQLKGCEKSFILFSAELKYEAKWTKGNQFTLQEHSQLKVLK